MSNLATSPLGYSYVGGDNGLDENTWNQIMGAGSGGSAVGADGRGVTAYGGQFQNALGYEGMGNGVADPLQFFQRNEDRSQNLYNGDGSFNKYIAPNNDNTNEMLGTLAAMAVGGYAGGMFGGMGEGVSSLGASAAPEAASASGGMLGGYGEGVAGTQMGAGGALGSAGGGSALPTFQQALPSFGASSGGAASGGGLGSLFGGSAASNAKLGVSLHDLYARQKMGNAQMDQYNQNQNRVNNLYAPGSPEYNLLAQKIARSNAASGRNSQVGQFATDLAGTIAEKKFNALNGNQVNQSNILNQSLQNRYGGLNSLFYRLADGLGA